MPIVFAAMLVAGLPGGCVSTKGNSQGFNGYYSPHTDSISDAPHTVSSLTTNTSAWVAPEQWFNPNDTKDHS